MKQEKSIIKLFKIQDKYLPIKVVFTNNKNTYIEKKAELYILKIRPEILIHNEQEINAFVEKFVIKKSSQVEKEPLAINMLEKYFYYLGNKVYFSTNFSRAFLTFAINDEQIILKCKDEYEIEKQIWNWLKEKLLSIVNKLIAKHWEKYNLSFSAESLIIRTYKKGRSWGTNYVLNKTIIFNNALIMFNSVLIEYVVVHELSHFIYQNHSKAFWNLVAKILPDYKKRKKSLNNHDFSYQNI